MNEQIKQIAERLAGLRDALEISPEEIAQVCHLTPEQYLELESGNVDISVSVLHQISQDWLSLSRAFRSAVARRST